MNEAVIVDAVRTPIGRAHPDKGYFRDVRSDELSAELMKGIVNKNQLDPKRIEDVRWGCVQQQGEQGTDVARVALLIAGFPVTVPGVTVNRNCASSLTALNDAVTNIWAGCEDVQLIGGVEHMDHLPITKDYNPSPKLFLRHSEAMMHMGLTAEYLAVKYRIPRPLQDEFSLRSHEMAAKATDNGDFAAEILPTWGRDDLGRKDLLTADQGIRRDSNLESLAKLPPAFNPRGCVTAGNSSQVSVGASAMLVMSAAKADELGLKPIAKVVAMGVAGVAPEEMGIGPVPAVHKALQRTNLKLADIGCFEINEAFAVQVLSVLKLLEMEDRLEQVNSWGGAIALGHPLGASGARIATTCVHRMRKTGSRYGLATLCVGQGQGVATLFELMG